MNPGVWYFNFQGLRNEERLLDGSAYIVGRMAESAASAAIQRAMFREGLVVWWPAQEEKGLEEISRYGGGFALGQQLANHAPKPPAQ